MVAFFFFFFFVSPIVFVQPAITNLFGRSSFFFVSSLFLPLLLSNINRDTTTPSLFI